MRRGHLPDEVRRSSPERGGDRIPVHAADRRWSGRLRAALVSSAAVLALTLALDAFAGTLSLPRAAVWTGLSALLFSVLLPHRTTAGDGWLAVRGLLRHRRVRTDRLVVMRLHGVVDRRLYLRDALGGWAEVDPRTLADNPFLWHELDHGARRSRAAGLLRDTRGLDLLADEFDTAAARTLFTEAGLR